MFELLLKLRGFLIGFCYSLGVSLGFGVAGALHHKITALSKEALKIIEKLLEPSPIEEILRGGDRIKAIEYEINMLNGDFEEKYFKSQAPSVMRQ